MHVALNLAFLTPGTHGGLDVYARRLTEALARQGEVRLTLLLSRAAAADGCWGELGELVTLPVDPERRIEWVRADQLIVPREAARRGADVLHSLASTGPSAGRVPRVVTVHDLNYLKYPGAHFGLRGLGMRVLVPAAVHRSRRVIASSRATKADLVRHLRARPGRVDVVPLAVGHPPRPATEAPEAVRQRLGAGDRPVALTVSAKRPHKNLVRLLEALALIPTERRPLLVLPGYPTPHEHELRARARALGIAPATRFLGWVSDDELENLYRAADVFVFPSLYEGFGLPVLEAMARGLPVATSARASLAEVAGDAAVTFDPESERSIAIALEALLGDHKLRDRLREQGPARAARFSWAAAAEGTLACYRRALA